MTIWDPISTRKVGGKHLCNQNQHTEGQRSEREREKTKGKQWFTLETKVWATGAPLKVELDTKAQDGK